MHEDLSRRERQILDALYRRGEATVSQVLEELDDPPGYDSVRTTLRILERKGFVRHWHDGPRYLYAPVTPVDTAGSHALKHLVRTFFGGSRVQAASALLSLADAADDDELERIRILVDQRKESS